MAKTQDDEFAPVERRSVPRAPVPGLSVEVVAGDPLAGKTYSVGEIGLESFFLAGDDARRCAVGQAFAVVMRWQGREVRCSAHCVRKEEGPARVGAVLKLGDQEELARQLLADVLQPAAVPRDAD
jgi:hypothetical protein